MDYPAYRKVLRMVTELHVRGFQRLRIASGMSSSGNEWRYAITPATNISNVHGAQIPSWDMLAACYSSADGRHYFGLFGDNYSSSLATIRIPGRWLAERKEAQPADVRTGYAGWYLEMLNVTYPDKFRIAYADWELPNDCLASTGRRSDLRIPLPPPGWGAYRH